MAAVVGAGLAWGLCGSSPSLLQERRRVSRSFVVLVTWVGNHSDEENPSTWPPVQGSGFHDSRLRLLQHFSVGAGERVGHAVHEEPRDHPRVSMAPNALPRRAGHPWLPHAGRRPRDSGQPKPVTIQFWSTSVPLPLELAQWPP